MVVEGVVAGVVEAEVVMVETIGGVDVERGV